MPTDNPSPKSFIAYYRVSTQRQGRSGLGLDAQRTAVEAYLAGVGGELLAEFTEVETGKGADALDRRPQLRTALERCKKGKAVLLIAKIDRLARNVHFVSGLLESGCEFIAADMPQADRMTAQLMVVIAEWEARQISKRTKEALAAAKARGVRLGVTGPQNVRAMNAERRVGAVEFANELRPIFDHYRERNFTQREMAEDLNRVGRKARRGGNWTLGQVQRVLKRLNEPMPITDPRAGTW